ncbi:killer cell lectin-like receptor subfamily F member 1 [Erinaceus europaeus]|uniref:Killer cell lectin-like receptor subfamily F member 1 n=1 Tax=Erinaceus europaeus TaxID=9365 RepID=A0A1S2Z9B2_ERIEU|nr:killer cell lectin-like receptor subfamily F member 1 [Erinaceus europaeus]
MSTWMKLMKLEEDSEDPVQGNSLMYDLLWQIRERFHKGNEVMRARCKAMRRPQDVQSLSDSSSAGCSGNILENILKDIDVETTNVTRKVIGLKMQEEIYMTLNVQSKRNSVQASQLKFKDCSTMLHWYKILLRISGIINIIMILTLVSLTLLVSQGVLVKCRRTDINITQDNDVGNLSVNNGMRRNMDTCQCISEATKHTGLCPSEWFNYKEKCYWSSSEKKSFTDSYKYCLERKSHLLILQDQLEVNFLQKYLKQSNYVWIGLNFTTQKGTWTWVDGSQLDEKIFPVKGPAQENSCVVIKENKMYSETCSGVFKWICQY